jgi:anti-sigma factor RsiW
MTCRELIDVLQAYLDRELAGDVVAELERHLEDCAPCRAYHATYRKAREVGAAAGRVEMPEEMKIRLRRFLLDTLRGS